MVTKLPTRTLGRDGPQVSAIGYGCMVSLPSNVQTVFRLLTSLLGSRCLLWNCPSARREAQSSRQVLRAWMSLLGLCSLVSGLGIDSRRVDYEEQGKEEGHFYCKQDFGML